MPGDATPAEVTDGHLLDGRVRYAQPKNGYRTGIEPVFLAASVPARAGQRVLEAGTGAGAGLLCLHHRVSGLHGLGLEIEPAMAEIAARNFAANDAAELSVLCADVMAPDLHRQLGAEPFDHIFSNPPWHDAAGTQPTGTLRTRAKVAAAGLLGGWTAQLSPRLKPGGSLTLIVPAQAAPDALAAFSAFGLGSPLLFPLWPRAGQEARILLLQAIKGGRAGFRLAAGLILHEGQCFTPAADAVLRGGAALDLRGG
jgi:tRNA1(Val) A37 N6-methylase TrmN6